MNNLRFGMGGEHIVHLVSPVDTAGNAAASPFVKLNNAHRVTFVLPFGTITGDTCDVTIEAATAASSGTEITVPFRYRKGGAINGDTWGAVTTADSTGIGMAATEDDTILLIDYDPAENPDYNFIRVVFTPAGSMSACEIAALAVLEERYPQLDHLSST